MNRKRDWQSVVEQVHRRSDAIRLACELEVSAPKLGNVHPQARFADCDHRDFLRAAAEIAPQLAMPADQARLGQRVLAAVQATREVTGANVNLGIILLIAPLAMVNDRSEVADLLESATLDEAEELFAAIRLAKPGGVTSEQVDTSFDVNKPQPNLDLLTAMRMAQDRDDIAKQYATAFGDFFDQVLPIVAGAIHREPVLNEAIVQAQLQLLSQRKDTLIERKCGSAMAMEVCERAKRCIEENALEARAQFDAWLRADGNRRNPGTTADLIAAALYWLLWQR